MAKFVSSGKNPYAMKNGSTKKGNTGGFVSKSHVGAIQMFRDNTSNITGKKVTFKREKSDI